MRILVIHNAYQQRGGEDSVVEAEIALLRSHGHEVATYFRDNDDIADMSAASLALQTLWSINTTNELTKIFHSFRPDVIHVHNTLPLISPTVYWAAERAGVPVVQTLHNFRLMCLSALYLREGKVCEDCMGHLPWRGVVRKCYRDSIAASAVLAVMLALHRGLGTYRNKVSRYIALNDFCRNKFVEAGFPEEKVVVKPNFCEEKEVRSGALSNKNGALFVGRLSEEKGVVTLLDAWRGLDIPLRVAGDGPLLQQNRGRHRVNVEFLGRLTGGQVAQEMSQASFLVMPSEWYEGFPMVLVEAFAHGLPVVASRLGAMAEIVEDGITGLHFEPGNFQDLALKVRWMHDHPEECQQMGENAQREYEQKYTPVNNYAVLVDVYQQAIDENKKVGPPHI